VRRVVAYELVSLDGVAESPDQFVLDFDEVMYENLARVIGEQDAVLLGRTTYDMWAEYWPTSDHEPFASFINGVPKHVVTSRPLSLPWDGASPLEGPLEDSVRELKEQSGGDIGVHGSISVVQSLLRGGLVDEVRLVVTPVVGTPGQRLFVELDPAQQLELVSSVSAPSGALLLDYQVVGPAGLSPFAGS
jgi:dihydrofolate reductase